MKPRTVFEWCPGYGPAPERPAPVALDPDFYRPAVVPFPFPRVDDFVQMATQNWEMH